jgi:hypothetical protein
MQSILNYRGPGSVVGIAIGYGLDGPGIESRWGEIFRVCPDQPWDPPNLLYNGYRVFPGGKERPGRDADSSSPSSAVVLKEWRYSSTPPMGHTACTEPQCLYKREIYLCLFLKIVRIFIHSSFCELNSLLPTYRPNSAKVCRTTQNLLLPLLLFAVSSSVMAVLFL